jgi:hypothetical protein
MRSFITSPSIIRMMDGRMGWAAHVARMGEKRKETTGKTKM